MSTLGREEISKWRHFVSPNPSDNSVSLLPPFFVQFFSLFSLKGIKYDKEGSSVHLCNNFKKKFENNSYLDITFSKLLADLSVATSGKNKEFYALTLLENR